MGALWQVLCQDYNCRICVIFDKVDVIFQHYFKILDKNLLLDHNIKKNNDLYIKNDLILTNFAKLPVCCANHGF